MKILNEGSEGVGLSEIFERLWKCRDFELSTLWQRSLLLGAFMIASYAGYGMLTLTLLRGEIKVSWNTFNLVSMGICCFGLVVSTLWIMMLKGSKAWYEIYESAIEEFRSKYKLAFQKVKCDDSKVINCSKLAGFGFVWSSVEQGEIGISNSLLSGNGGCYSVSRTAMLVGQISTVGWVLLSFMHCAFILKGRSFVVDIFSNYACEVSLSMLGAMLFSIRKLKQKAHSSTLQDYCG